MGDFPLNAVGLPGWSGWLPPSGWGVGERAWNQRWTIARKAAVVEAVVKGRLTRQQAFERYLLSEEELGSWERLYARHGQPGLRQTRLQHYRSKEANAP